jgi:enamine deaminase RidA (YjgF/YER057c/UK114 family)
MNANPTITIADKLKSLGHDLPHVSPPVANYVSTVRTGNLLFIAGQISPREETGGDLGTLGAGGLTVAQGRQAAEGAALSILAQIAAATDGRISSVRRVIRLGVFVAASPEFTQHPAVANGASDLIVAVFGEAGKHARAAVGVSSLPVGAAVEVDAVVELKD